MSGRRKRQNPPKNGKPGLLGTYPPAAWRFARRFMAGGILSHAQKNNLGGSPGVESGAKQLARRARLLSGGLSGGRQLVANDLDLLGVANGDGLA